MADSNDVQRRGRESAHMPRGRPPPPPAALPPLSAPRLLLWLVVAAAVPVMVALLGVFARYLQASTVSGWLSSLKRQPCRPALGQQTCC